MAKLVSINVDVMKRRVASARESIGTKAKEYFKLSLEIPKKSYPGVALDECCRWLHARKFPISDAAVFKKKDQVDCVGCLEFFDFSKDLSPQRHQERVLEFVNNTAENKIIDGLALWIWAGFDYGSHRSLKSNYPFGFSPPLDKSIPSPDQVKVDICSKIDDPNHADSWRNIIMIPRNPLILPAGSKIKIVSHFEPYKYTWDFYINEEKVKDTHCTMDYLYHRYGFD